MASVRKSLIRDQQQGIGLVEVLVSLLLLAVAALGYLALQGRALGTTDEAIVRTQAQTLLRDAAESIRVTGTSSAMLALYKAKLLVAVMPTKTDCTAAAGCTIEQVVANDVLRLRTQGNSIGVALGMDTCPGTADAAATSCLIAAWNSTTPTTGTASPACMNDETGVYFLAADCVYMEAY